MREIRVIASHELKRYFDHPTAYVLWVAFAALSLFLTFRSLYASGLASLRPLFDWLPLLFTVFVPAATMRSLAEERREGTLLWLLARPVTEADVVLGKFLGYWGFVLIVLAATVPTAIGVFAFSQADPGIIVAEYVGTALLGGLFVAIGLFASSITRNQVTAFIVAAAICLAIVLIGLPIVQAGLLPSVTRTLARLSVVAHFGNVARGVLDARDILYFVSGTAFFLALSVAAISKVRLSPRGADARRLRLGVAVTAVLVIMINLLGDRVHGRLDLTRDNLYTLADGSRALLGGLDDIVRVTLYASRDLPPEVETQLRDVRDLLSDMRDASNAKLIVTELDPDRDEAAKSDAMSLGIRPIEFNVTRASELRVQRAYYGMGVAYGADRRAMPVIERTDDLELRLTSAIASMTRRRKPTVGFATGFGLRTARDLDGFAQSVGDRYDIVDVPLDTSAPAAIDPETIQALVVAGPTTTLDEQALQHVRRFVERGGATFLLLEPIVFDRDGATPMPVRTGLEALLAERGVHFDANILFDLTSHERLTLGRRGTENVVVPYPLWPVTLPATSSIVTRSLKSLTLAWSGSFTIDDPTQVTPLLQTTAAAGVRSPSLPITPDQDWREPATPLAVRTAAVAIAATPRGTTERSGRMIAISDVSFLDPQFVRANPQNMVFVANAIDWLTQDESLIRIRSKSRSAPPLVLASDASRDAFRWGNVVGVPAFVACLGVVRSARRRRREMARWKSVIP